MEDTPLYRVTLRHGLCDTEVEATSRTVIAQPSDVNWPRDVPTTVAWCPKCKCVVGLTTLVVKA